MYNLRMERYDSRMEFHYFPTELIKPVAQENDWERTKFVSGHASYPDADKRAKLRAKRKKKNNG